MANGHQTWQGGDLWWQKATHQDTSPFVYEFFSKTYGLQAW